MANWAEVEMAVTLPSRNKDGFLGFFLDPDGSNGKRKGKHLKRCFLESVGERRTNTE